MRVGGPCAPTMIEGQCQLTGMYIAHVLMN